MSHSGFEESDASFCQHECTRASPRHFHLGTDTAVVQPLYPCPSGSDGEMLLYIRVGKSWRPILRSRSDSLMVDNPRDPWCPVVGASSRRSSVTHGWPDLIIGRNISVTERQTVCLRF